MTTPKNNILTDRDLLLLIREDLKATKDQIKKLDKRVQLIEANQTVLVGWARQIALSRHNDHIVAQIDAHLEKANGTDHSELMIEEE